MSKIISFQTKDFVCLVIAFALLGGSIVAIFNGYFGVISVFLGTMGGVVVVAIISYYKRVSGMELEGCPLVIGTILHVYKNPDSAVTVQFKTIEGQLITVKKDDYLLDLEEVAPQVQPGNPIPLRYNPDNPRQITIAIDENIETLQHALNAHWVASGMLTEKEIEISKNGVKARGEILSAIPTGRIINSCAEMTFEVKVMLSVSGETYHATVVRAVPQSILPYVRPGNRLDVFYMPGNEKNITIRI
ncbi:MAG: DUF3592 domain-containing protein [Azoarcus sp.]|jgi:hypothetical protein|nr:DUF3592 domain-containing protein [Azoarcus sp.]